MADAGRVTELIKIIASDGALRERLAAATDADRATIVAELGFADVSAADVQAHAGSFVPEVAAELDDAELDLVEDRLAPQRRAGSVVEGLERGWVGAEHA